MTERPHVLVLGNHGVWAPALYGAQLRSERLAAGLAESFRVTYGCAGETTREPAITEWQRRRGIDEVLIDPAPTGGSRWGGPSAILRALWPNRVPIDVREFIPTGLVDRLRSLASTFDAVWAHRVWFAEAARAAGCRNIICDIDDFMHVVAEQQYRELFPFRRAPLHRVLNARLARYERAIGDRFPRVALTKEEDRALVDSAASDRCHVIPNGFDLPAMPARSPDNCPTLLFVGNLRYGPNVDAMGWLIDEIMPIVRRRLPSARLLLAGRGTLPPALAARARPEHTEVLASPETLDVAYARAHVAVTPVRLGHGTRIKALEALAYAKPLVSTTEALRGHPVIPGEHALVADSTERFAEACVNLITDPIGASKIANSGRQLAESLGGWHTSAVRACDVIRTLIGSTSS